MRRSGGRSWPLADAPATDRRGSFQGQSGHPNLTSPRQLMTQNGHRLPIIPLPRGMAVAAPVVTVILRVGRQSQIRGYRRSDVPVP
jgi:hypothetical protein